MATAYSRPLEYGTPTPVDFEVQFQVQAALQQKYDANALRMQEQINQYASAEIAKGVDKEYLYERLEGVVSTLNSVKGKRLHNLSIANKIQGHISTAIDDKVMNAIASTQAKKAQDEEIEWYKKNKIDQYNPANEYVATMDWERYMNSEEVGDVYRPQSYIPYYNYNEEAMENFTKLVRDFGVEVYYTGQDAQSLIRAISKHEKLSEAKVMELFEAALGTEGVRQMQIDAIYQNRGIKDDAVIIDAYKAMNTSYGDKYKGRADQIRLQASKLQGVAKENLLQQAEIYDSHASQYYERNTKDIDRHSASTQLFKNNWLTGWAQALSYDKVIDMEFDNSNLQIAKYETDIEYKNARLRLESEKVGILREQNEREKEAAAAAALPLIEDPTDLEEKEIDIYSNYTTISESNTDILDNADRSLIARELGVDESQTEIAHVMHFMQEMAKNPSQFSEQARAQYMDQAQEYVQNYEQLRKIQQGVENMTSEQLDIGLAAMNADGSNFGSYYLNPFYIDRDGKVKDGNIFSIVRNEMNSNPDFDIHAPENKHLATSMILAMNKDISTTDSSNNAGAYKIANAELIKGLRLDPNELQTTLTRMEEHTDTTRGGRLWDGVKGIWDIGSNWVGLGANLLTGDLLGQRDNVRGIIEGVRSMAGAQEAFSSHVFGAGLRANQTLSDLAYNDWNYQNQDGTRLTGKQAVASVRGQAQALHNIAASTNNTKLNNKVISITPNNKVFGEQIHEYAKAYFPDQTVSKDNPIQFQVSADNQSYTMFVPIVEGSGKNKTITMQPKLLKIEELPPKLANNLDLSVKNYAYDAVNNPNAIPVESSPVVFRTEQELNQSNAEYMKQHGEINNTLSFSAESVLREVGLNPSLQENKDFVNEIISEVGRFKLEYTPVVGAGYVATFGNGEEGSNFRGIQANPEFIPNVSDKLHNLTNEATIMAHNYVLMKLQEELERRRLEQNS